MLFICCTHIVLWLCGSSSASHLTLLLLKSFQLHAQLPANQAVSSMVEQQTAEILGLRPLQVLSLTDIFPNVHEWFSLIKSAQIDCRHPSSVLPEH